MLLGKSFTEKSEVKDSPTFEFLKVALFVNLKLTGSTLFLFDMNLSFTPSTLLLLQAPGIAMEPIRI